MKFIFSTIIVFIFITNSFAQDVNLILREADRLELVADQKSAFLKFKEVLKIQPSNAHALSRCAELCSSIGSRESSTAKRNEYYNVALIYAQTAYKLYPNTDEANVSMAIAEGRIVLLKSGKEKIASVKKLKQYAEKAIEINSNNYKAWHILGKWHYEVSGLNSIERGIAKLVYGALPASSLQTAINCYEKAKTLSNNFSINYLELAKAYKRNGEKAKAVAQLNNLISIKSNLEDDIFIKDEGMKLLKKLS